MFGLRQCLHQLLARKSLNTAKPLTVKNFMVNTKVTVSTQKKSHLGSSDLAADGTVYFNGQHEDTTCPQTTA